MERAWWENFGEKNSRSLVKWHPLSGTRELTESRTSLPPMTHFLQDSTSRKSHYFPSSATSKRTKCFNIRAHGPFDIFTTYFGLVSHWLYQKFDLASVSTEMNICMDSPPAWNANESRQMKSIYRNNLCVFCWKAAFSTARESQHQLNF